MVQFKVRQGPKRFLDKHGNGGKRSNSCGGSRLYSKPNFLECVEEAAKALKLYNLEQHCVLVELLCHQQYQAKNLKGHFQEEKRPISEV